MLRNYAVYEELGWAIIFAANTFLQRVTTGLTRSIRVKNPRRDPESWGGLIGLTWMTAYWATLIPMWMYYIVRVLATHQT